MDENKNTCVGPRGVPDDTVNSGCPTRPRYRLQLDEVSIWSCERHLPQAVRGFKTSTPVAVSVAA